VAFAAIPGYLPAHLLSDASPGLRFNMYLPIWGEDKRSGQKLWNVKDGTYEVRGQRREERRVDKVNKRSAMDHATALTPDDQKRSAELRKRQAALARPMLASGHLFLAEGRSVAPFATGLGNEHLLENGFSFLNPYGMPYLPGSSVKGVVRAAARELGWNESLVTVLFGHPAGRDEQLLRGVLSFWDVFPAIRGDRLLVELMTPHQSDYYAPGENGRTRALASPHDSGDPNPIFILTVPPESLFGFHVSCDMTFLATIAAQQGDAINADVVEAARQLHELPEQWKVLLSEAFDHAFSWMGFGAKTAVGYGAMVRNHDEEARIQGEIVQERKRAAEQVARLGKSEAQLLVADYIAWCDEMVQSTQGRRTKIGGAEYQRTQALAQTAREGNWTAQEKAEAADAIEHWAVKLIVLDAKEARKRFGLAALRGNG
jgi:CRISPR-associated protein Cmr6